MSASSDFGEPNMLSDNELRAVVDRLTTQERAALIAGRIDEARAAGVERLTCIAELDRRYRTN